MKNIRIFSSVKFIHKRNIHKIISEFSKLFGLQIYFLEINIVSSNIVLELNKKYLNHFHRTDILTFNYSNNKKEIDGEIYISFEDAQKNSIRFKNTFNDELKRLVIHGILHLIGYDDSSNSEKKQMKLLEKKYLNLFEDLSIIK